MRRHKKEESLGQGRDPSPGPNQDLFQDQGAGKVWLAQFLKRLVRSSGRLSNIY